MGHSAHARSASAVIVSDGFTPRFALTADPSTTCRPGWPWTRWYGSITPVDGGYEWVDEGGPKKQPYYIRRRDGQPALCASIGQFTGSEHDGFVIITADAQGGMVDVHDRRPVVLSPDLAREWICLNTPIEHAEQMALNLGEPAEEFEWFLVSTAVGNVRNQGPDLVKPILK